MVYFCFQMISEFFTYNKSQVIQALRFHFISRKEIKFTIILVNVFAIASFVFYFLRQINSLAFLFSSGMWFVLMISFWFALPYIIYRRSVTFQNRFQVIFSDSEMTIQTEKGSRSWPWNAFSTYMESPVYFHLYFDTRTFFLVPKAAFSDVSEARHLLKNKIK